ncbi:MAG: hypothetical protein OXG44_15420 [Gammaproteobacteria bacterium]|nr:hypothetical protein [Gammaproteobacteria bacterium]
MDENIGNLDVPLNLAAEFLGDHCSCASLSVLLRPLTGGTEKQMRYRVVVIGNRMAAEPTGFERDRAAAGEGIKHGRNLAIVRRPYEFPSNTDHLSPLDVLRIGSLPPDEGAVVEQLLCRRRLPALPGLKLERLRRPLSDER